MNKINRIKSTDGFSNQLLTCELQRATQRAVRRSQQRQAGVFGIRVLQTLHQWDGCVLDKLHQQLERKDIVRQIVFFVGFFLLLQRKPITSGLESSSSESMGHPLQNLENNSDTYSYTDIIATHVPKYHRAGVVHQLNKTLTSITTC